MTTRCKFRCTSVEKSLHWASSGGFLYAAKFTVIVSGSPENEAFFAATPSGSLSVSTVKNDVFEVGKDYYLDISLVE